MLRIGLFLATNLAVLLLLSLIFKLTGLDLYAARTGTDLGSLLIFAGIIGFAGSFISLAMSKWLAKMSTRAQVIEQPRNEIEAWLLNTVRRQADAAGIGMPEVAVFDSPEPNAFATGMSRNNALVAVSTGLLRNMSRDEVEAVLGHEVAHVANGDMVTMALIQGVLNTFVIFLSRVIGRIIDQAIFKSDRPGIGYYVVVFVLEIVLGLLASIIAMWFSRWREFRADAGGARLAGRHKMISALQRLQANQGPPQLPQEVAAFGISGGVAQGLKRLFMSHPPLGERIAALQRSAD